MSANNKNSNHDPVDVARWIYRTAEGNIGPLDTKEFLEHVRMGRVLPRTQVRLCDSSQWMTASEISGLEFPETSTSHADHSANNSHGEQQSVAHNREMQKLFAECVNRQYSKAPKPRRASPRLPAVQFELPFKGIFSSIFSSVSDAVTSALEPIAPFCGRAVRSRAVWLSVAFLCLVAIWNPKLPTYWFRQRQIYSELQKTVAELKGLRARQAEDTAWKEFQQRSATKLTNFAAVLSNAPVENYPAMAMLFASKNLLPSLLEDREGKDIETLKLVELVLKKVDESFQKPIDTGPILFNVMIVLDVVIVCAVLMYFGRGWISRRFAAR